MKELENFNPLEMKFHQRMSFTISELIDKEETYREITIMRVQSGWLYEYVKYDKKDFQYNNPIVEQIVFVPNAQQYH